MDESSFKDDSYSIKKDHCQDFWNLSVPSGQHYIPGADPCILCLCENGKKFYCQAVRCAASEDCLFYTTGKSCCEFICMDKAVEVLCGFCLISLLLLIIFVYYLRKRKQKTAGEYSQSSFYALASLIFCRFN